jgi:glycosyltransferase involved in cell wall biosynthesis
MNVWRGANRGGADRGGADGGGGNRGVGRPFTAAVAVALTAGLSRRLLRKPAPPPEQGLEILHLAFEDHRRPGSGGGGVRTHEINRRLAGHHRITVVTTRYPGARRRVEDGVTYRPLGLPLGYFGSIISYHLGTPLLVMFARPDLVVEDFSAPMSSMLVPLWTSQPTIAVVQWLFAGETSRRYRVPFYLAEGWGLRLHRHFVAVSEYMADRIRAVHPGARIHVVYPGVAASPPAVVATADPPAVAGEGDRASAAENPEPAPSILYLGRLQASAKGLDLLLGALGKLAQGVPAVRLVVAGDGPDRAEVESLARSLGLAERVTFVGRVEGEQKWELLRHASVVAVPSRYESFGLVVLEALAAGTPVVGFQLPSLKEIVTPDCGILVAPFDVDALAEALRATLCDPGRRERMGAVARSRAERFNWDDAATAQEKAYLAAVDDWTGRRRLR